MTKPWIIHTIVLDLDDTLYAEREFVLSGFKAASRWLEVARGIEGLGATATELFESGVRGKIFDDALRRLGFEPSEELVSELVKAYRSHAPRLTLLPDANDGLKWMKPRFRLGLLTDGYHEVQQKKIDGLGIEALFDVCILTDRLGRHCWKPSTAGFLRIMQARTEPAHGYVYIADNPRKDFIGPKALGWRTIRIRRAGGEHSKYEPSLQEAAELEISSLFELPTCLTSEGK